jgi:small subunit ribosomal protein S8
MPYSKSKHEIATILEVNHFVKKVSSKGDGINKQLVIQISVDGQNPNITEIHRVSRPGSRHYAQSKAIGTLKRGRGLIVISTSKGVMSGDDAKKQKLGGEIICEVY